VLLLVVEWMTSGAQINCKMAVVDKNSGILVDIFAVLVCSVWVVDQYSPISRATSHGLE